MVKVVAAVIEQNGKILICRRKNKDGSAGKWEFPGGKQEPGETERECLSRELMEELCLVVQPGDKIEAVRHDYGSFSVEVAFYRAKAVGGEMKLMVHEDAAWVQKEALCGYDFLEADIGFVRWLAEGKR